MQFLEGLDWYWIVGVVIVGVAGILTILRHISDFFVWLANSLFGKPRVKFRAEAKPAAKDGAERKVYVFCDNETNRDVRIIGISVNDPWRILTDKQGSIYGEGNIALWREGEETKSAERPPLHVFPRTSNQGFKFIVRPKRDVSNIKTIPFALSVLIGSNPKPKKYQETALLT